MRYLQAPFDCSQLPTEAVLTSSRLVDVRICYLAAQAAVASAVSEDNMPYRFLFGPEIYLYTEIFFVARIYFGGQTADTSRRITERVARWLLSIEIGRRLKA